MKWSLTTYISHSHITTPVFVCTLVELQTIQFALSSRIRHLIQSFQTIILYSHMVHPALFYHSQGPQGMKQAVWFKFFQKHQIWLICPLWYTVSIFAERQYECPLAGRHFEKNQDGLHFSHCLAVVLVVESESDLYFTIWHHDHPVLRTKVIFQHNRLSLNCSTGYRFVSRETR